MKDKFLTGDGGGDHEEGLRALEDAVAHLTDVVNKFVEVVVRKRLSNPDGSEWEFPDDDERHDFDIDPEGVVREVEEETRLLGERLHGTRKQLRAAAERVVRSRSFRLDGAREIFRARPEPRRGPRIL